MGLCLKWEVELAEKASPGDLLALLMGAALEQALVMGATALCAAPAFLAMAFCEGYARSIAGGACIACVCAICVMLSRQRSLDGAIGAAKERVADEGAERRGPSGIPCSFFAGGSMELENIAAAAKAAAVSSATLAAFAGIAWAATGDVLFRGAWAVPAGAAAEFLAAYSAARLRSRALWRRFEDKALENK